MEQVVFEDWTLEKVVKEAESFLARTKRLGSNLDKHDFAILFSSYLVDNMLRGYVEDGKVHFRWLPELDMIEEAVEKLFSEVK